MVKFTDLRMSPEAIPSASWPSAGVKMLPFHSECASVLSRESTERCMATALASNLGTGGNDSRFMLLRLFLAAFGISNSSSCSSWNTSLITLARCPQISGRRELPISPDEFTFSCNTTRKTNLNGSE